MLKLIETLNANRAELEELIKAAGDDQVGRQPPLLASTARRDAASVGSLARRRLVTIHFARASQQKKMMTVIPKLQGIIAGPMQEAGFPPPPAGECSPRISAARPALHASLTMFHSPSARRPQHGALFSPAGMMQGMMAFTAAGQLPGGDVITRGMGVLQKGMMGVFPSAEELDALLGELK